MFVAFPLFEKLTRVHSRRIGLGFDFAHFKAAGDREKCCKARAGAIEGTVIFARFVVHRVKATGGPGSARMAKSREIAGKPFRKSSGVATFNSICRLRLELRLRESGLKPGRALWLILVFARQDHEATGESMAEGVEGEGFLALRSFRTGGELRIGLIGRGLGLR